MWIKGEVGETYQYEGMCHGAVEFRTNGYRGGDAGHGGFLEISFDTENCSTALEAQVDGNKFENVETISIKFLGDAEIGEAINCFEFIASKLRGVLSQIETNNGTPNHRGG